MSDRIKIQTLGEVGFWELPNGRFLVGMIQIDCEGCGQATLAIPGHHMRSINRLLAQWIEQFPELTGPEEVDITQMTVKVRPPGTDPANN
jgi:hypothetical protein